MSDSQLNRRDLHRLTVAAIGGLFAGTLAGCGKPSEPTSAPPTPSSTSGGGVTTTDGDTPRLLQDPHICRGINTCKNKGKKGSTNECAGQGHCATVGSHSCDGQNDCKGQGGCASKPGENACKGKGACAVPLKPKTWTVARKRFEDLMNNAKKKFGDAPPDMMM